MPIDDDDKGARRERYKGMVGGLGVIECDTSIHRQNREGTGSASVMILMESMGPVAYTGRAREGMQGDGVGLGDISEVPDDAWSSGDTASGDDGRSAGRA